MSAEKEILKVLGERFERVYLFGSRARKDSSTSSDIDIIVIDSRFRGMKYWERIRTVVSEVKNALKKYSVDLDVIALTPEELKTETKREESIIRKIFEEGMLISLLSGLILPKRTYVLQNCCTSTDYLKLLYSTHSNVRKKA